MTKYTTLKEIKRIARIESAQDVSRWNVKDLHNLKHNVANSWKSLTSLGIGAILVEDNEGRFYFASSRSSGSYVLF